MSNKLTIFSFFLIFALVFSLAAQTLEYKSGVHFPTIDQDSVLSGLKSVRGSDYHPDPLGNGVAAFAVTNYVGNGYVHVFKAAGDDSMELVWTSPKAKSNNGRGDHPRYVMFGDLDNDDIIEVIVPNDLNGIQIYEWDGVADSWNFGTEPSREINSPSVFPVDSLGSPAYGFIEFMDIGDFDGDGQNELITSCNARDANFDRYYIFSVTDNYSTNNPGFSVVTRENNIWAKGFGEFGSYGGGSPYGMAGANLDGTGNDEIIIHAYNYGHVTPVRIPDANTYQLADTTGGSVENGRQGLPNHFIYSTYPKDCYSLGGMSTFDIDGDGREEVYIPLYSSPENGECLMVHYEEGDDLSKIDSSNVYHITLKDIYDVNQLFGKPGIGDYDDDGKPNLYFAGARGTYIMSAEFQGGDKTDPVNWINEVLYSGEELDKTIFHDIVTTDSADVSKIDTVLNSNWDRTIAMKISANYSDFDNDGYEDMIMPSQAWYDSINVTHNTWIKDTSWTDTLYAGTDSMETVPRDSSIWTSVTTKIAEPVRIGIRFLESSVMATGLESKDLTVITPKDYKLRQNYPNPFNPETTIEFVLPIRKKISLTIYNSIGQKIKTLISDEIFNPGSHEKLWDGTNDAGIKVATGMYIYELKFGNFKKSKRMMLIK